MAGQDRQHRRVVWMRLKDPELLAALIKSRGISHRELVRAAGLKTHGMIGHLTKGRRFCCTTDTATGIAVALGVPTDLLFVPHVSTATGHDNHSDGRAA